MSKRLTNAELNDRQVLLFRHGACIWERMSIEPGRMVPLKPRRFRLYVGNQIHNLPGHGGTTTHRAVLEILRKLT